MQEHGSASWRKMEMRGFPKGVLTTDQNPQHPRLKWRVGRLIGSRSPVERVKGRLVLVLDTYVLLHPAFSFTWFSDPGLHVSDLTCGHAFHTLYITGADPPHDSHAISSHPSFFTRYYFNYTFIPTLDKLKISILPGNGQTVGRQKR